MTNARRAGSERAEHKGWAAAASEAADYYRQHGGEAMTPAERAVYDQLIAAVNDAADRHDDARNEDRERD